MLNLLLNQLKLVAKLRCIKGYKSMSKEKLLSALSESESAGSGNDFDNARMKKISEDFNKSKDRFLKPKIKEIRRKLYDIEKKGLSKSKIKEIEQNLIELEESLLEETHTVHTKSLNIDIMMGNETDIIIKKLLESLLQNCPKDLEESLRKSEFFL